MKAVVYDQPYNFRIGQISDPEPGPGEVRLRITAAGVCGTDVHLHEGEFFPVYPLVPGHEVIGEVDAVGDGVTALAPGRLVALDNMITCGLCDNCQRGKPTFCRELRALGVTEPGGFAEYVVAPADKCHPVDDLDLDTAVLAEPTACAVHGLDVLQPQVGSDVLIIGMGPTGLILSQLLAGIAGRVTAAAPTRFKLELAQEYGADEIVDFSRTDPDGSIAALRSLAPEGFDIVVDATGSLGVLEKTLPMLRTGGTLFVYGMASEDAKLPISPYDIFRRELTVKGSFSQAFSFDRAVAALRTGRVRGEGIVTHRFALESYDKAIETVRDDRTCLKAVINP